MVPAKILVVDDEKELERLIKQRFRKRIQNHEFDFLFAGNGLEALQTLQTVSSVDMVLTDIQMPEMDGITLLRHLPSIDETLKAVVLSAYDDRPRIRQAMNGGAFDFLTKPINFEDLENTIDRTLRFVHKLKHKKREVESLQEALFQAALQDSLTGLPNRINLCRHLETSIATHQVALLFIDLDGFKTVNDSLGHLIGDVLLKEVAQRLQHSVRGNDIVARLGGDEFVVLLEPVVNEQLPLQIAQRILSVIKTPFYLEKHAFQIGASIGIALSESKHQEPQHLLHQADLAMYTAKAKGKGQCVLYSADTHEPKCSHLLGMRNPVSEFTARTIKSARVSSA